MTEHALHKFIGTLGLLASNVRCPFIKSVWVHLKHARYEVFVNEWGTGYRKLQMMSPGSQRVRVRVRFRAVLCSNIAQFLTILRILHCRMGLVGLPENRTSPVYGHNSTAQHLYKPTNSRTVCVLNSCVQCIVPAYHTTHHAWQWTQTVGFDVF